MWQHWINAVLGVWLIALSFIGLTTAGLVWALVLTGIVVAVLSLWGAGEEAAERSHMADLELQLRHGN